MKDFSPTPIGWWCGYERDGDLSAFAKISFGPAIETISHLHKKVFLHSSSQEFTTIMSSMQWYKLTVCGSTSRELFGNHRTSFVLRKGYFGRAAH